jgi:DNA-binding XRE family transcriptional regulator
LTSTTKDCIFIYNNKRLLTKEVKILKRNKLIEFRGNRSQAEMADKYGVTQQAWCRWENGYAKPRIIIMKKIEMDSGIPMEMLFFDVFNNKKLLKNKKTA